MEGEGEGEGEGMKTKRKERQKRRRKKRKIVGEYLLRESKQKVWSMFHVYCQQETDYVM